jgi:hypothetical protein
MSALAPSRWLLALAAFALGSILTLAAVAGVFYVASDFTKPSPPSSDSTPVYPRPEFSRRVMGKTEAEVIQAVGKPDETSQDNESRYWHFKKRTRDPLTGGEDSDVQVVIKDGKVVNINY